MKLSAAVWYELYLRVRAHREALVGHVTQVVIADLTLTAFIFLNNAVLAASQETLVAEVSGYRVLKHAVDNQVLRLPENTLIPSAYGPIRATLTTIQRAQKFEELVRAHQVPDGPELLAALQAAVEEKG